MDTFAAHNTIMNSERFGKGNLLTTKGALINRNDYVLECRGYLNFHKLVSGTLLTGCLLPKVKM